MMSVMSDHSFELGKFPFEELVDANRNMMDPNQPVVYTIALMTQKRNINVLLKIANDCGGVSASVSRSWVNFQTMRFYWC